MSLVEICPSVSEDEDSLVAATSPLVQIATLGVFSRRITIRRHEQAVKITRRLFWFFSRTRQIPFSQITGVTYGYSDMSTSSMSESDGRRWDWFSVGILLRDRDQVHGFFFIGDGGSHRSGLLEYMPRWIQKLCSTMDRQESQSRHFAESLSKRIGVPIVSGRD